MPQSDQWITQWASNPYVAGRPVCAGLPLFEMIGRFTFSAAAFTTPAALDIPLFRLPPGKLYIRMDLSKIKCPVGTLNSDLDIGLAAYTKPDGTTQAAQGALLLNSFDIGGGSVDSVLSGTYAIQVVDSLDGVIVAASFDTANSPAAGEFLLRLIYHR